MYKKILFSLTACLFMLSTVYVAGAGESYEPGAPHPLCGDYKEGNPPPGWPSHFASPDGNSPFDKFFDWDHPSGYLKNLPDDVRCNLLPPLVSMDAEEAFDRYQKQGENGERVIIIDVRTPEEVYWVGQPAQVNGITLKADPSNPIKPDYFKAVLTTDGHDNYVEYHVGGELQKVPVSDVKSTDLSVIVYNIPVEFKDTTTGIETYNGDFGRQVDALIRKKNPDRIIFYCRSGKRSSTGCYYDYCPLEELFARALSGQIILNEVEAPGQNPDGSPIYNGLGGFESTNSSDRYLGYRGFPGRITEGVLSHKSASFKDAGLPILIGETPRTLTIKPGAAGRISHFDELDEPPATAPQY